MSAQAPGALWQPGDRVQVCLPDKSHPRGGGHQRKWFSGTVRISEPTGVIVDLDSQVNGAQDCYATQAELRAEDAGQ